MSYNLLKLDSNAQSQYTMAEKLEVDSPIELLPEIRKLFPRSIVKRLSDDYYEIIRGRKTTGYVYAY